jgi:hypothetical protein
MWDYVDRIKAELKRQQGLNEALNAKDKVTNFLIFTDKTLSYDDGYGEHGNSSYSTHKYLGVIGFETKKKLWPG